MNNYVVYKHTLRDDGRVYIGQTKNVKNRWIPSAYRYCTRFYRAINKYGWDSFDHKIVLCGLSLDEANVYEELLIEQYDATNPKYGFNLLSGGLNKKASIETRRKIGKSHLGKKPTSETREKMSRAADNRKVPVMCMETGVVYDSVSSAMRDTGVDSVGICGCCKGKQSHAGGYHWRYV